MKPYLLVLFLSTSILSLAQDTPSQYYPLPEHPRLLWSIQNEEKVRANIANDAHWQKIHEAIIHESNTLLTSPPLERVQIGRRLLHTSREALRRILFLSYTYRITKEIKYAKRVEKEMLKVAQFHDWNPSHFLDVAEMTLALAIGYDWVYNTLHESSRKTITNAIIKKGLKPSYNSQYNWFVTSSNNWNQVCNAGMTLGALAIYEDQPDLAFKTISRAIESIQLPLGDYKPSGAYPEGPGYWIYGTSFNAIFINALEVAYGTDFGISASEGFLASGRYAQHVNGTTGYRFNYSDAGSKKEQLNPTKFWFASKLKDPSLLYGKNKQIMGETINIKDRILPMAMIWGKDIDLEKLPTPEEKYWQGDGVNPVCFMRSGWQKEDVYVGFKAGRPNANHGQMDVGTFVIDALGERWALDLGAQGYESLESKGVKLWDREQNGERWQILRYNNLHHNTLSFDQHHQVVDAKSEIISVSNEENQMFAIADMTPVYINKVKSVKRGVALMGKTIVIQDEIKTGAKTTLGWSMLTPAKVEKMTAHSFILSIKGKKVKLSIESPLREIKLRKAAAEPVNAYDAPNPGISIIGFDCVLPANSESTFRVSFSEIGKASKTKEITPLINWK